MCIYIHLESLPDTSSQIFDWTLWALSIQPKIPEIFVCTRFGPTRIFGISSEGSPLWSVWSFRSVGPKCLFPFGKIVVLNTALLYPAYKNNNQTRGRGGLGRVWATGMYRSIGRVEFPKFQNGIFVEWKAPSFSLFGASKTSESTARLSLAERWMITEFADSHISCGHTTDFYLGKTDLPRANSSKIFRGKFISGFVLPR